MTYCYLCKMTHFGDCPEDFVVGLDPAKPVEPDREKNLQRSQMAEKLVVGLDPAKPGTEETLIVGNFGGSPYKNIGNLQTDLEKVLERYRGMVSKAEAIGTLETVKLNLHGEN